jgi:hypothetical protein
MQLHTSTILGMSVNWKDPFGSNFFGLWLADRRDRKAGQNSRIAGRWGWLKPLGERGKVIWIIAGSTRENVHQAVELTAALRAKRLDIRLVLTFEQDYPDLLAPLDECDKTGWGYAPCDHPRALARAMQRLEPYGFIVVNTQVRPHLQALLNQHQRVLVTHPQSGTLRHETIGQGADLQTLLTQAQIDPNFKTLVNHGNERHLWWWHSDSAADHPFIKQWISEAPEDVLFVSGYPPDLPHLAISQWDRQPLPNGQVVWVDDTKWLPAVSASVTGTHFSRDNSEWLWQAMAGGAAITCVAPYLPKQAEALLICPTPLENWRDWRANPIQARQAGDRARRLFWQERRQAESDSQALTERVFEW